MVTGTLGLSRSWVVICKLASSCLSHMFWGQQSWEPFFSLSCYCQASAINSLCMCPAWMMLSIIWKCPWITSLSLIFQNIQKPKKHFFLDSEQRSEHWGNKRPCTCFGGTQGKEVGGDEGNPSLELADVSDMGREEFFTQEITVFNLELATRVYIFGAFRWKSNFLTALLTWMI